MNANYIYSPVSLSPADGWRVIYLEPDEDEPGWWADPLIAWGVFEVIYENGVPDVQGREIHGVIMGDYAQCVEESGKFWRYAPPGASDPTPEEVQAERTSRAGQDSGSAGTQPPRR
jgi:hypothetical protein